MCCSGVFQHIVLEQNLQSLKLFPQFSSHNNVHTIHVLPATTQVSETASPHVAYVLH